MKLHFIKKKESRSDLQVAVSKKNKVIKKKREALWKVDPKKRVLHIIQVSWDVELPLIMDFKFLYLWSDLFYVYLWTLFLTFG